MRVISYILAGVVLLVGITFAILNATPVTINYYIGTSQLALSMLLIITLAFGVLLGLIACSVLLVRYKRRVRKLTKRTQAAEKEVANLRALPIKDSH